MRVALLAFATAIVVVSLTCAYAGDDGSAPVSRSGKGAKPPAAETQPTGRSSKEAGEVTGNEKLIERVVTGIGTDPDKALQSAFSQAIESTVGVLVDSETIVKNDQIIKDQILTFSKGFVRKFEVVKQWQGDGLHHATIKALVETGKLTDKLKANNIDTHEVPGELLYRQFRFDFKNEKEAAEMLDKVLAGYDMTKLAKVELDGKPEIKRDGENAEMKLTATVTPDTANWNVFLSDIKPFLDKVAGTKKVPVTLGDKQPLWSELYNGWPGRLKVTHQLEGDGVLVMLFAEADLSGSKRRWNVYRVPEPLDGALRKKYTQEASGYHVVFVATDKDGKEILRTIAPLSLYDRPNGPFERSLECSWTSGFANNLVLFTKRYG